jgi:hypothetical protein
MVVCSPPLVSQISSDQKPGVRVTGASTGYGVCHFVEKNLVDIVIIG